MGGGHEEEKRKHEEGRKRSIFGRVSRTKWKECWQAGCSMGEKWDSHTAVFWRRGTPKIGVTVFHCQGEEAGRNTGDTERRTERRGGGGRGTERPCSSWADIT